MLHTVLAVVSLASGAAAAGHVFPDCSTGPLASNKVCDTTASIADRAKALVAALTIEEKINLTVSTSPGVPRLGLPSYQWWQEALHGVASSRGVTFASSGNFSYATSFPVPLLMSAAFDDNLIEAVATVVSTEARAFNNANMSGLDYWTPNINPYRDPRWGRGQETPGEDPFHIKSYVKSLIKGLQGGENPETLKVIATCKHFVGYDIENWLGNERYEFDAEIDPQELSEYYMQPFQACARDAKVGSVMCSYNALNGVPTCADNYILEEVLRKHWNWTEDWNYVVSDCDAIQNVYLPHAYSPTREGAAADSLVAGTDLNCGIYYQVHLPGAWQQGLFKEPVIDQALVRLYSALIKLGYFDPASKTPYRSLGWGDVSTPYAQDLARKAAEEGIVLLKNDGTLPLSVPTNKNLTIAFIGGWANATTNMQGNYAGIAPYLHTPYYSASQLPHVNAIYSGSPGDPTTDGYPGALSAANAADVIVYADGIVSGESDDRYLIRWSGERIDIMTELAGLGKPFIILQMGDLIDDAPFIKHPNVSAIVWASYPGQSGGDAILNVMTGKVAPAGRLPVTQYPANYVNEVPMTDMSLRPNPKTGNPGRTYMWYDNATLPFGYGLHYTNFSAKIGSSGSQQWSIHDLVANCSSSGVAYLDQCPFRNVPITVANTGKVTSDFVALGFISGEHGPQPYPLKRLAAYERLFNITAASSQTANLNLTLGSLARHDERGNLVLYPGSYNLLVDVPTQATWKFTLTGTPAVLDTWPEAPVPKMRTREMAWNGL